MTVAFALVATLGGTAAAAPGFDLRIPIDTVVRAPEGSQTQLASVDVSAEAEGQECTVVSEGQNQRSVHPGNDLVVESGDSQVLIPNVEADPGGVVSGEGTLTLGATITVTLSMGPDEVFSGGFDIVIDCDPHPGRIIVVKEVAEGSDTSQAFEFSASYDSEGFSLAHGEQSDSGELAPGTYSVSESVPEGWTLVSATCDDGSPVEAIDLSTEEVVTCTFVNEIVDQVGASIQVSVSGVCQTDEGDGFGVVDVTMSVADGAIVVVRDSDGDVVGTLSSDGTMRVEEDATYTWEATANEGFEFPPGFESSGSVTIESCSDPDPETLPFTGPASGWLAVLALSLVGSGTAILSLVRSREGM